MIHDKESPLPMEPRISIITLGVRDMRASIRFYRDGLGFGTSAGDDAGWAIFRTAGARLALFPKDQLAADMGLRGDGTGFCGVTFAHNVRSPAEVDRLIKQAVAAGGEPPHGWYRYIYPGLCAWSSASSAWSSAPTCGRSAVA